MIEITYLDASKQENRNSSHTKNLNVLHACLIVADYYPVQKLTYNGVLDYHGQSCFLLSHGQDLSQYN